MLSALGVPAAPALPAAPGVSLGAGNVDPMDNVLSGGISSKKQSCVCTEHGGSGAARWDVVVTSRDGDAHSGNFMV